MSELESSQQKILSDIPVAEFRADSAQSDFKDNICGDFYRVEGGASSLVIISVTSVAAKNGIAQTGGALQLSEQRRLAVGTIHESVGT